MFYKVDNSGILYIMRFWLDDRVIYKIGVTKRKPEERLMDILLSFYKVYRYVPRCDIKRFTTTDNVYAKESIFHKCLKAYSFSSDKRFSGATELFCGIDEEILLYLYDRCLKGQLGGVVEKFDEVL